MKNIILGLFLLGITIQTFGQVIEIHIEPASYKYIDKVGEENAEESPAEPVKLLQQRRSIFNLENSRYYEDEYDNYFLSFYIPEGKILNSYDAEGNILRSVEKLKNTEVPAVVAKAMVSKYPGWVVSRNVYLVKFLDKNEVVSKEYKALLERGNQRRRVKIDENGNFIRG